MYYENRSDCCNPFGAHKVHKADKRMTCLTIYYLGIFNELGIDWVTSKMRACSGCKQRARIEFKQQVHTPPAPEICLVLETSIKTEKDDADDIPDEEQLSEKESAAHESKSYFYEIVHNLNQQFKETDCMTTKMNLIRLLPNSWSAKQIMDALPGCTTNMIKVAKMEPKKL